MNKGEKQVSGHSRQRVEMKPPVFILGSPRSGTTLLYHMLLSSGGFAIYLTESNVFNLLVPKFGNLNCADNKQKLMKVWLQSKLFKESGLTSEYIEAKILTECKNGGDFLRIIMEEIAYNQKVDRWADCTPAHLLCIPLIKEAFPDALIIHIIRDGRDVALSLERTGWMRPLPWQRRCSHLIAGLYWDWAVSKGRKYGGMIAPDYAEVRFEELVLEPGKTLARVGQFIKHDLRYDRIQKVAIGAVRRPNTSFDSELSNKSFSPIGRWKQELTNGELSRLETLIGDLLDELHYPRGAVGGLVGSHKIQIIRALYRAYSDSTLWLKQNTPVGRVIIRSDLSWV
jgi:hypothetical protein